MDIDLTDMDSQATDEVQAGNGTGTLQVESLTIAQCASLADNIRQALASGTPVLLDLSNCQEADTAGLQLLVTLQNDPAVNLQVHWTKPSEVVAMKAARLGMQSWINAGFLEN